MNDHKVAFFQPIINYLLTKMTFAVVSLDAALFWLLL